MCPRIQEIKVRMRTKRGKKIYNKNSITIPRMVMKLFGWKCGDELAFDFEGSDFYKDRIFLKRVK